MEMKELILKTFTEVFGDAEGAKAYFAPGRVNLIEVMGLAVLPARLKGEMAHLKEAILAGKDLRADEELAKHVDWVDKFRPKYDAITAENIDGIVEKEIGLVFMQVLEDAGVYKRTEEGQKAFDRFVQSL